MRIIIPDSICCDEGFINWLVREIKQELIMASDERQLQVISSYIEEKFEIQIDIYDAFMRILDSIKVLRGYRLTQIVIHNRVLYRNKRLTTLSLAKLIDVGNIELRGTHIFTIVFNRVRSNLRRYFAKYILENGGSACP